MLLHVSSDSMAAVVFPFAETVVTVKVLTTPVGAMSLVFCGKTAMLLQDSERLDQFVNVSSAGMAAVVFPSAETTEPVTLLKKVLVELVIGWCEAGTFCPRTPQTVWRWWSSQVRRLRSPPPCSDATLHAAVKAHSRVH